ncbi:ShlB/FhaC/HecB family hemolysin secretion/activation protein [Polaromonas sp. YR568]|uniref:ShlB/FhaC/HecB family hemolysin secretion/activation protein n=1 Tax=Polaromonas sp. YR568 TaxID=1855301 RepID=UPI00398BEEBB
MQTTSRSTTGLPRPRRPASTVISAISASPVRRAAALLCGAACLAGLEPAAAAGPPDAGSVLQQLRPPPAPAPREEAPAVLPAAPEAAPVPASTGEAAARVRVAQIRISGASVFAEAELLAVVQDAIGRELDFAGLEELAARLSRFYRQHGYTVARAYLPPQDIQDGVVQIAVVEGRYSAITVKPQKPQDGLPAPLPLAALAPGELVNDAALERSLLLAADVPGIAVRSTLQPGASVGTSELVVEVEPGPAVTGLLEADNFGSRATGSTRVGASVYFNNPAGLGDLLSLRALTAGRGLNYGRLAWQLPVGGYGTRVGAAVSAMDYRLGREFESLEAHGTASIVTLFAAHPLLRSRARNLNVQASAEHKRLRDRIDLVGSVDDKQLSLLNLGVSGDARDDWGGGGAWSLSATYTRGQLDMDSAAARAIDEATVRSAGGFGKLGLQAVRQQSVGKATLLVAYTGQWGSKNLDSSEKLPLGGAGAVRAYPQGEAPSDRASLLTLELQYPLGEGWHLAGFFDAAVGYANTDPLPAGAGTGAANRRSLSGAGLGLNWAGAQGWSARIFYARKLHGGPATAEPDRGERVWLQLAKSF